MGRVDLNGHSNGVNVNVNNNNKMTSSTTTKRTTRRMRQREQFAANRLNGLNDAIHYVLGATIRNRRILDSHNFDIDECHLRVNFFFKKIGSIPSSFLLIFAFSTCHNLNSFFKN